ncbi:sulfatase family protein [Halomarina oriensis]|uniref:Sulfatase-like hydrolase/transferase n=1 Tax=Halomarina oriensis TaxID=671145 RepID=A0A6B0GM89_9EURY|nr:sulfatase [Halomarina oriensis]MWG33863.1 sulfatase-like hydrolase/transferase [Halomarina oriensis]
MSTSIDTRGHDGPDVVFLHCHDLGRHLGCYGAAVETPRIDALAGESVRFTNYLAAAPTCSPSRGSLMTGRYPHRNGLMGLQHRGWELHDDEVTFPDRLRAAGYDTHLFGVQHVSADPDRVGYDHVGEESTRAHDVVDAFAETLDDRSGDDAPYFASLGFHEPHTPFRRDGVPDGTYDRYDPDTMDLPSFLPDTPDVRERLAEYRSLITGVVDPAVGRVVDLLDERGLAGETLLVVTTDHGIPFERAKATCFDAGLACALVVRPPARSSATPAPAGTVRDELLSGVDLAPTLLDLVGVEPPDRDLDGRSFAPLVTGVGEHSPRERLFAEQTWHAGLSPSRAIRTPEYKFVMNATTLVAHAGKSVEHPEGRIAPEEELYRLDADPDERENLASDLTQYDGPPHQPREEWLAAASDPNPDHVEALGRLRAALLGWMAATDDPLADGCLPLSTRERSRWRRDEQSTS